jgi:hypothetical protein
MLLCAMQGPGPKRIQGMAQEHGGALAAFPAWRYQEKHRYQTVVPDLLVG